MKVTLSNSGQSYNLEQTDYVAGGGEGKIYRKGSIAFKIYHDPAKMIDLGKIQALCKLSPKNVLAPRDICESGRQKVGFTMRYISDRVYLCWMFNKIWKQKNNIDYKLLSSLVNIMRSTTITLHSEGCIVGDYNELQFLVDKKYTDVYFCDTDSYQIAGYPCTAIMDTVRDRLVPFGKFSEKTDWFGFAIVTIQLFLGVHPYQGNHPNFTRREVKELKLMDKMLSIFNKDVTLPRQAEPLGSIPNSVRHWYEGVLEHSDRSTPPEVMDTLSAVILPKTIVQATTTFTVKELFSLPEAILDIQVINGIIYSITKNGIYKENKLLCNITNATYNVIKCIGNIEPLVVKYYGSKLHIYKGSHQIIELYPDGFFAYKGNLYTISSGSLLLHEANLMGVLTIITPRIVAQIFENSYQIFDGTIIQDIVGIPWIIIPTERSCQNIQIKELSGHRVLDAKYDQGGSLRLCIIISEHKSNYFRSTIFFQKDSTYSFKQDTTDSSDCANFTVLDKSVAAVIIGDERLDLVMEHGTKEIKDPPIDISMQLFTDGARVLVVNGNKILHISTK
jgi:hypothetical protein